jgi:hypothetical protein
MTNLVVVERGATIGHRTAIFINCDVVDLPLIFGYVDAAKAELRWVPAWWTCPLWSGAHRSLIHLSLHSF